jgi:hypothetical protein
VVRVLAVLAVLATSRRTEAAEAASEVEPEGSTLRVDPEARRLYDNAVDHFKAGKLDEAVAELEAAFRIEPAPELLYNLGQAYRLKRDCRSALDAYRRFIETRPTGIARERAEARVAEMRRCIESDTGPAVESATTTKPGDLPSLPSPSVAAALPPAQGEPRSPVVAPRGLSEMDQDPLGVKQQPAPMVRMAPSWFGRNRTPLVLAAATVVLASLSGYFAWRSHQASDRMSQVFEHGGTWTATDADNQSAGLWDERLAVGSGVLGLGTGAIAAWWLWRER